MNYLDFLRQRSLDESKAERICEAFKTADVDKVHGLMLEIFKKKIGKKVFNWDWLDTKVDGNDMKSFFFINMNDTESPRVWSLNYLVDAERSEVYSISFYDEKASQGFLWSDETNFKSALTINTLGTSVAYFIPIICHVVNNDDYSLGAEDAKKIGNTIFKGAKNESRTFNFGAAEYKVFENLTSDDIKDIFMLNSGFEYESYFNEANQAQEYRWKKKAEREEALEKWRSTRSSVDKENFEKIAAEYAAIVAACKGGAKTIEELKMAIKKNVKTEVKVDKGTKEAKEKVEEEGKDPKQAFKEMQVYVKTVLKGMQPGVILCGAPGIGKTYRVLQQLKAAGYEDGKNMDIIKGKCTPRQLYQSLFHFRMKGHILVIDDADALVGPKAPEDCINMLKAALDSTSTDQGRKVSYRVSGELKDDDGNEIPKTCFYNGGVIVITNYSVGQLDTALRGRTFIQSLDFTTKQLLQIIEELIPAIDPTRLTMSAKKKAYNYLVELSESGADMEISIRTFGTCAKLFTICEDDADMSDDDVKSMIKEQMANQSLRGGKKF